MSDYDGIHVLGVDAADDGPCPQEPTEAQVETFRAGWNISYEQRLVAERNGWYAEAMRYRGLIDKVITGLESDLRWRPDDLVALLRAGIRSGR